MRTSSHPVWLALLLRRCASGLTLIVAALGAIANAATVARLAQSALSWLTHLRLP